MADGPDLANSTTREGFEVIGTIGDNSWRGAESDLYPEMSADTDTLDVPPASIPNPEAPASRDLFGNGIEKDTANIVLTSARFHLSNRIPLSLLVAFINTKDK